MTNMGMNKRALCHCRHYIAFKYTRITGDVSDEIASNPADVWLRG